MQVKLGDSVEAVELITVDGRTITVPDSDKMVHLQFLRFAGCPICNVHLQSVINRHGEIAASGIEEVVLFHSSPEELETYVGDLPFAVVADPEKTQYRRFGVETGVRAVADPRSIAPVVKAMFTRSASIKLQPSAGVPGRPTGGKLGLPADILIDRSGTVVDAKYGSHASDQWSVDELLQHAAARR
jgi:peroxiredoxin